MAIAAMTLDDLRQGIAARSARYAVLDLGYVGLPLACMFAKVGFQTLGVDSDAERVATINRGESPIHGEEPGLDALIAEVVGAGKLHCTTDFEALRDVDIITVSAQSPFEDEIDLRQPLYEHLAEVLRDLGRVLKPGALVIIESTLAPGTTERVIIPALEESTGGKAGEHFWVGYCPERLTPGKLLNNLTNVARVVGGQTPEVAEVIVALYSCISESAIDSTDVLTAEIVKTTENAYRDIEIAFANELARICEDLQADVWTVRDLINKSPGRNALLPGAGVGGQYIPKDSLLLIANVPEALQPSLIPVARAVNRAMPGHVVQLTEAALQAVGLALQGATIAVMGYAYRENSDDTRDTPSQAFIDQITRLGATVRVHDPYVRGYQTELSTILQGADAAVILVAHDQYVQQDWHAALTLMRKPVLVDARHVLPDDFAAPGAVVRVLGRG